MPKQQKPKAASVKIAKPIGAIPFFPKIQKGKPTERVMFKEVLKGKPPVVPLHVVISNGVLLEISPKQSEAIDCINHILPSLGYVHHIQHPTGRTELVSSR